MAGAFNRLTPPSEVHSDGRLKDPAPGLQPWDKMRYSWRGSLGICIRQMKAAFGASVNPVVTAQSDRVELDADELDIQVHEDESGPARVSNHIFNSRFQTAFMVFT